MMGEGEVVTEANQALAANVPVSFAQTSLSELNSDIKATPSYSIPSIKLATGAGESLDFQNADATSCVLLSTLMIAELWSLCKDHIHVEKMQTA